MKFETFLKVMIILAMSMIILILGVTGVAYLSGHYEPNIMTLHIIAGFLILTILPIHIYLRWEKLKKLLKEFFSIITTGGVKQTCTNHAYLKTLRQRSLRELCDGLNICMDEATEFLDQKGIVIYNFDNTLDKIANDNKNDPLKIFALIIENHYQSITALDQM